MSIISLSKFVHLACAACLAQARSERQVEAHEARDFYLDGSERCCWCSEPSAGLYFVHMNPERVPCRGVHAERPKERTVA